MEKLEANPSGRLAENVIHFARALRAAGVRVGPDRAIAAAQAAAAARLDRREDLYHALEAALISRVEDREVFAQCFRLFWRDPQLLEKLMGAMLPQMRSPESYEKPKNAETRAASAMMEGATRPPEPPREGEEIETDATLTFSPSETLKARDFEQMTAAEAQAAKAAIARLFLPVDPPRSRRLAPHPRGGVPDWRATIRASLRDQGQMPSLKFRQPTVRAPALVALCDISGSMSQYSRMLLHFLHAASNAPRRSAGSGRAGPGRSGWSRVHVFTFGTRLTNITRALRARDADAALDTVGREARDWEGGTRIGACLHRFNRDWSRRVLGQGAVVLLITDGLDRDDPDLLSREAERLGRSCRRLVWLNPLLRWEGFAPRAQGVRAILPHVDSFRAAHNIESLEALAETLARPGQGSEHRRLMQMLADSA